PNWAFNKLIAHGKILLMSKCKPINLTETDIYLFWSRVEVKADIKQCWLYRGGREPQGYGTFDIADGTTTKAHRVAYIIHYKKDIFDLLVRSEEHTSELQS